MGAKDFKYEVNRIRETVYKFFIFLNTVIVQFFLIDLTRFFKVSNYFSDVGP